jgi:ammonia channel protein AmtB
LLIAWRAGPRLGVFSGSQRAPEPGGPPGTGVLAHRPHNLGLTAAGVGLALFCVPFLALGCGYIVPGAGYFGIALTTSGFGVVLENIFMAFMGGAITGAVISYLTKNPIMALLGPVAGYIGGAASFDIVKPLGAFAIALIAPLVVYGVYLLLDRMRIDDKKIVPLTLGGGVYAVIAAGIAGSGTATGGYFGLKGAYAFQVSTVTLGHQLLGLVVTLGIALISGVIVIVGLEKTIGLRVSQEAEIAGLDHSLWGSAPGDVVVVETPAEEPGLGVPTSRPASAVQPAPGTSG